MEFLLIGEKISITRTDGRVHSARVESKHEEIQTVTAAWAENNKLMGKEIPWDCILALNPHLKDRNQADMQQLRNAEGLSDEDMFNLSDLENIDQEKHYN